MKQTNTEVIVERLGNLKEYMAERFDTVEIHFKKLNGTTLTHTKQLERLKGVPEKIDKLESFKDNALGLSAVGALLGILAIAGTFLGWF